MERHIYGPKTGIVLPESRIRTSSKEFLPEECPSAPLEDPLPANHRLLKVAAYIRVSTRQEDQENSYENQERYFHRLLAQNPHWICAGIYSDYGRSGTNTQNRSGFRRMLRHCREGRIDRIICKSISRFARNTTDLISALKILKDHNITVFFEQESLDTGRLYSDFVMTTLGAIAQEESRSISENVRWGIKTRFPKGEVGNIALYGYRYTGSDLSTATGYTCRAIKIQDDEACIVRQIFLQAAEGKTFSQIARYLNINHVPAPVSSYTQKRRIQSQKGQLYSHMDEGWTSRQISQILHQERYTGDVLAQKTYTPDFMTHKTRRNRGEVTQYLIREHHPAIISRDLYGRVQNILEINKTHYGRPGITPKQHPFSKRLICGKCGRFYHIRNTSHEPVWFCPTSALNNGLCLCHAQKLYQEQIITTFRQAISERFAIPLSENFPREIVLSLEAARYQDRMERDRSFLQRQIHALSISNTRRRSQYPFIPDEQLIHDIRQEHQLSQRLRELEKYWDELEDNYTFREKALSWINQLPKGEEGKRAFLSQLNDEYIKAFIFSITIHSDHYCTIHWFDNIKTQTRIYGSTPPHAATFQSHAHQKNSSEREVISHA